MAAMLHDEFLRGRESLVVAGTHGKTTTTSMLAWIYEVASQDAMPRACAVVSDRRRGGELWHQLSWCGRTRGRSLLEGDEYDTAFFDKGPKFLHYFPDAAILTHVEFDHADIYADLAAVKTAFKRLVNLIPRRGRLVAFDGSENVTRVRGAGVLRGGAVWLLRRTRTGASRICGMRARRRAGRCCAAGSSLRS